ncbi:MAG TPA: hypothetical protein VMH49_04890, partial [Thermoplasmata archaeon]|nr:hypothetical protein [Thermoplasmata archaeon]
GMLAVCSGAVQIGAASFPVDAATLVSTYGCSASVQSTIVVTTVAYDAVDAIVQTANPHGVLSISYDTIALIYADGTVATGGSPKLISSLATDASITENGQTLSSLTAANPIPIPSSVSKATVSSWLKWDQIPATVEGASVGTFTQGPAIATTYVQTIGCGVASGPAQYDTCYGTAGSGTYTSTCGFLICAGGQTSGSDTGNAPISTVARSDASGTTQSFEARLLDAESSTSFATQAQLTGATTGFNGCGGSNYISDCGFVSNQTGVGNPGVISAVAANPNAIGYASDGLVRASGSGVVYLGFLGVGQTVAGAAADGSSGTSFGGIIPTTGSSGTIALGIKSETTSTDYATGYLGWRPFDLVTLSTPAATAAAFIQYALDPANNQALATQAQEVSVYSV